MVTAIRVSNNNRAETVLDLFLEGVRTNGVPSRVRGDHGGENVLVTQWMETYRGAERGSYICIRKKVSRLEALCAALGRLRAASAGKM